jgi:tRNA (adenine22-N1)-methyltransferase
MADIGTDHGFLPIELVRSSKCPKVIMTDISQPSLNKSIQNAKDSLTGEELARADFRCGDGLRTLKPGEVNAVVIAGMGGKTIVEMLEQDEDLTNSFDKFIFQPRNGQGELWNWLYWNGYIIENHQFVREGNFIPEIITAYPNRDGISFRLGPYYDELESLPTDHIKWRIPRKVVYAEGPVREFLEENLAKEDQILEELSRAHSAEAEDRITEVKGNIEYLEGLLMETNHE